MHWVAFTTLFNAPLSSCAALKPPSDAFNKDALCGAPIEVQKQFQDIWLETLYSKESDSLRFPVSPWIQNGMKSLCCLEVYDYFLGIGAIEDQAIVLAPPDILPCVSSLKYYCL